MNTSGSMTLTELIANRMDSMRKSEQRVAHVVIEQPELIVASTMAAVAAAADVSEPTVMRFCTGLGFDGFRSFKLGLAQALAIGLPSKGSVLDTGDSLEELAAAVFDHTIGSLDRARRSLDFTELERAVEAILASQSLVFVGLGASAIIAQDADQKSAIFGLPCSAPVDTHQQFMAAALPAKGATFVVISNTGRTRSIVQVAERARANGATVIGISGDDSPLLQHCDIPLICKTFENTDIHTPTVSRLAGLVVVDLLSTAVSMRRGPEHLEAVATMKEGLLDFGRPLPPLEGPHEVS